MESSPAVANGVVYSAPYDYNLYALNAKTGESLELPTGNYITPRPSVANGMVYFGSNDGNIYAFSLPAGGKDK